jgi:hypothetical protein
MQKTKLGLSVGLVGAALYFLGLFSFASAFLLAGYVLLMEENEWLKKTAVKMVTILVAFYLVGLGISYIEEIIQFINNFIGLVKGRPISVPYEFFYLLDNILWLAKILIMVLLGFKAMKSETLKLGPVDKVVDDNM